MRHGEGVQHLARRPAGGVRIGGVREPVCLQFVQGGFPGRGGAAGRDAGQLFAFFGVGLAIGFQLGVPFRFGLGAPRSRLPPEREGRLGHLERRVGPAQLFAGGGDFRIAQRRPMGARRSGLGGRAPADDGAAGDQGRFLRFRLGGLQGRGDGLRIVAVHALDMPVVSFETLGHIFTEGQAGLPVDGDLVVIVKGDQAGEAQMAGQGAGLVSDSFLQAAVPQEHIGMMIDHLVTGTVETRGQPTLGQCQPHGIGNTLPQRAGGHLHAGRVPGLRVAGRFAVQLAEIPQFLHGQIKTRQVEQTVKQHGAMPVGKDESVPIEPTRIGRVEAQITPPEHRGDIRHAHGHSGMAGIGLLNGIHGKEPQRIGCEL